MDPRNTAGSQSAAANEVDEFMEAMGAPPAAAPETPPAAPVEATPPDQSSATPDDGYVPVSAVDTSAYQATVDQSIPEQPVEAQAEVAPPADNSAEELARYRREAEAAQQAAAAYRQQVEAYNAAMQAEMVRAQQRQVEQQRAERVNQAMAIHQQLIDSGQPEKAADYIRSFYDGLLIQERQASQAQLAQLKVQTEQERHRLVAPQYAAELVRANGLPQEYVSILSQFDGYTQDRMVAGLKAQYETQRRQQTEREQQLEQRLRDLEAAQRAGAGWSNPSGNGGAAAPATGQRPSDPREAEVWDYLNSPLIAKR